MPFNLRSIFKKKAGEDQPVEAESLPSRQVRPLDGIRPAKYPRLFLIGSVLLIALCGSAILSRVLAPAASSTSTPTLDYSGLATSAFETAIATQLSALQAVTQAPPASPSSPSPQVLTATPASTAPAGNPWVAAIPEAACIPADIPQAGTVVAVIDGTTIKVLLYSDGRVYSVRYLGAAMPAGSAEGSIVERAAARNMELTYRKHVLLVRDLTDADNSGRLLRYVMAEDVFVNYALVAEGLARAGSTPPDTACLNAFEAAQQQAQMGGLGLWALPANIMPLPTSP